MSAEYQIKKARKTHGYIACILLKGASVYRRFFKKDQLPQWVPSYTATHCCTYLDPARALSGDAQINNIEQKKQCIYDNKVWCRYNVITTKNQYFLRNGSLIFIKMYRR